MLYDVKVLNDNGAWQTDLVTGSLTRALERGRFLIPRVPSVQVTDQHGERRWLI